MHSKVTDCPEIWLVAEKDGSWNACVRGGGYWLLYWLNCNDRILAIVPEIFTRIDFPHIPI